MSAQIVVDISSGEEDNAAGSSKRTRSTGTQLNGSTRTSAKSPSRRSPTADKPTLSTAGTTACSENRADAQPSYHQSKDLTPTQPEQQAPKDQTLPAAQNTTTAKSSSTSPLPPLTDDAPKPTPLDINAFRHLVCAGAIPTKDAPLITSIQPAKPPGTKRKATDSLEHNLSGRLRLSPLPPTPYTGTSEHPVPPKSTNSLLWSVPAYKAPPPLPPPPAPASTPVITPTTTTTTTTGNPPPQVLKQPSIPNIHAPFAHLLPTTSQTPKSIPPAQTSKSPPPPPPPPPSSPPPPPPPPTPFFPPPHHHKMDPRPTRKPSLRHRNVLCAIHGCFREGE